MLNAPFFDSFSRALLRFALVLSLVALSGCFRMGLPEHFSAVELSSPEEFSLHERGSNRRVLLLLAPQNSEEPSFGHQYLLFALPLTRLYLEHGKQTLAEELMAEILRLQGYDVITAEGSSALTAIKTLQPKLVLRVKLQELSLNAYDAFFFRILGVNFLGEVELLTPENSTLFVTSKIPFAEKKTYYRRSGHAPLLSTLLSKSLKSAFDSIVQDLPRTRRRAPTIADPSSEFVYLPPPRFQNPPARSMGTLFAHSYGFRSLPAFSDNTLLRIFQRGLHKGLKGKFQTAAALREMSVQDISPWQLNAEIEEMAIHSSEKEALMLIARLQLTAPRENSISREEVIEIRCQLAEPIHFDKDGSLVFTLEAAAERLSRAVLQYPRQAEQCERL